MNEAVLGQNISVLDIILRYVNPELGFLIMSYGKGIWRCN